MAASSSLNEEIEYVKLYQARHLLFHLYLTPFVILYIVWLYLWTVVYGVNDYFEAGLIALAIVGLVQILTCLFCHWSVHVRCAFTCKAENNPSLATVVKVVPTPNNGFPELLDLHHEKDEESGKEIIWFSFQKTKYLYDAEEKKQFYSMDFPIDHMFKHYQNWKGFQEESDLKKIQRKYDNNRVQMEVPEFMKLFKERATAPFFVFQVFCVGLWCLDEYWYYSVFTLFMLVAFEATLVQQQMRNLKEIRNMGSKPHSIQVYRNRKWRPIQSDELLPGDICSMVRSHNDILVPCDILLLRGSCIVDEAMLTGESVPQMKEPVESLDEHDVLDIDQHGKLHMLSGGTKVVQHTPPPKAVPGLRAPDNGCVGYVLRTGFNTSQGKLLRTILFGVKRVTANNLETFMFIMFLLIFALSAAGYVWIKGSEDPKRNRYKLFLECTLILTSVVPPELPIELSLAVNSSLVALIKLGVYCTEPFRIPFAGKVDVCCFDKTGTLTSDNLVVQGVTGLDGEDVIVSVSDVPNETLQVLASCHSLAYVDDMLVGDPLEKAALSSIDWTLTKGDIVMPKRGKRQSLRIVHRYHFSSSLKRMSSIASVQTSGSSTNNYIATVKGAPETLISMYETIPDSYEEIYQEYTCQGARVLALGYRELGELAAKDLRELTRDEIESNLQFAGFLVISCPLKVDSKPGIKEIQNSSHHTMMITGDNPLTACHVASELRIARKKLLILTPSHIVNEHVQDYFWETPDKTLRFPMEPEDGLSNLLNKFDLCLTGEALTYLQSTSELTKILDKILLHVKVFARVAPKQKELVITKLKSQGFITLMCGDGTNDVGALKHAHVGVSLITGAPESLPEKKKDRTDQEAKEQADSLGPGSRKPPPALQGRSQSKAAKMRAMAKGEPTGSGMKPDHEKKLKDFLKEIDDMDQGQIVHLGDASIASPFTSKLASILCVCHIIKQGRCTLVTTLQMFKILALNALILAYSQSVLYLDGIKFSDGQATLQGILLAGCFLFISRSKPLKVLSKERPLPNIFNIYTILTVMLQFAIHFMSLYYLNVQSKRYLPGRTSNYVDLDAKFAPSLVNSTVYLISVAMQLNTFAINYKGHPFMESLTENKPLLYSIIISGLFILGLSSGSIPDAAAQFEIVEFPEKFRKVLLQVIAADFLGALMIDRICEFLLGRAHLKTK